MQRGIRWVAAHAADYGVDPNKLAMLGVSAGGHLAIMAGQIGTTVDGTGQTIDDPNPPASVRAVAAWSPPTKLSGLTTPTDADAPPDCTDNKACTEFWRLPLVSSFIGCSIEKCPKDYDAASPYYRINAGRGPGLVLQRHRRAGPAHPGPGARPGHARSPASTTTSR